VAKTAAYTRAYAESNGFMTLLSDGQRPSIARLFPATRRVVLCKAPGASELIYDAYDAEIDMRRIRRDDYTDAIRVLTAM
jgi:hypothetical protein